MPGIVLLAAGGLAYSNCLEGEIIFDSEQHIAGKEDQRSFANMSEWLTRGRRPMVNLSLALNEAIGGLDPRGYRAFNLGVHLLAGLALWGLVRRTRAAVEEGGGRTSCGKILRFAQNDTRSAAQKEGQDDTWWRRHGRNSARCNPHPNLVPKREGEREGRPVDTAVWILGFDAAWWVALLWLVHPLPTQCVTYSIQRAESMMGLFYILTLYCVARCATADGSPRGGLWQAGAILSCALGMGSKGVMVTAPVMALLYDRTFLAGSVVAAWRRRPWLYVGLAATWGVLIALGTVRGVLFPPEESSAAVGFGFRLTPWWKYLLTQAGVLLHYIQLSFWPARLCLDYAWPTATTWRDWGPQGLAVVGMLIAAAWGLWRWRWWGFAGAWFFVILAPTSSLIPIKDAAVEHRMYVPLAGVVALFVFGCWWAVCRVSMRGAAGARRAFRLATVAVAVVFAVLLARRTHARNADYRSELVMWTDVVNQRESNSTARNNLGKALIESGEFAGAATHLSRAVELEPSYVEAHSNLAAAMIALGRNEAAVEHCRFALSLKPDYSLARNNLAAALTRLGRHEEAIREAENALQSEQDAGQAHKVRFTLGMAREAMGDLPGAASEYLAALATEPSFVEAYQQLGFVYARQERYEEAIAQYRRALELDPGRAEAMCNMGAVLQWAGRPDEAAAWFTRAISLRGDYVQAHANLGRTRAGQGRPADAAAAYRRVVELTPNDVDARLRLAEALGSLGRWEDAAGQYEGALRIEPGNERAKAGLLRMRGAEKVQ